MINKENYSKGYLFYPLGFIIAMFLTTKAETSDWGTLILIGLNIIYPAIFIISNRFLNKPYNKKFGFYLNVVLYLLALKTNLSLLISILDYDQHLSNLSFISTLSFIMACFILTVFLIYYRPKKD